MNELANWEIRRQDFGEQAPISLPKIIWNALASRGIQTQIELESLFKPSLNNLSDPLKIHGMACAVDRLIQAYEKQEKLAIYADFDLDGTSGLALFYEGLTALGYKNIQIYQPKRLSEGYGLHVHAIEDLAQEGVGLIITIDVGITAIAAGNRAQELNVDLIITDHHMQADELPKAFCIVNPNLKNCDSGLGYLCGAGVAFYLLLALKRGLSQKGYAVDFNPKDVLDFFVIGTITDLVPLKGDNRVLIKHGLVKLSQTQRPGLKKLLEALGFDGRSLTSQDVGVQIAPKLNALSRMETDFLPRHVLLEKNLEQAQLITGHVLKTQEMRKAYQKNAILKALDLIKDMNQEGYCWVWSHEFHKGVIGLVATHLAEKLQVPCFVGSVSEEGIIIGSSRLPDGSSDSLLSALGFSKSELIQFGGHNAAAGFKLSIEKTLQLDLLFKSYFGSRESKKIAKKMTYDCEAQISDFNGNLMNWIYKLEPFGKEFPPFLFLIQKAKIVGKRILNGGHLRWTLSDESHARLDAILFFAKTNAFDFEVNDFVDVLVEPQWNYFNGTQKVQLMVKDFRK